MTGESDATDEVPNAYRSFIKRYHDLHVELSQINVDHSGYSPARETTPKDGWFRGAGLTFYPWNFQDLDDFSELVERNLLADLAPIPKLFTQESNLLTFGSCFAQEIRRHLVKLRNRADAMHVPEGLNNTFALLSYVRWGFTGSDPAMEQWYIKTADGKIQHYLDDTTVEQESINQALMNADGFIFTFGMTEVWRDKITGGVFWRGIPGEVFDERRHQFHNSSLEENIANIDELYKLIRLYRPNAPIIFTVSPVPLGATWRNDAAIVSDCVSKSILRASVDSVMRRKLPGLYYWPSFEIVKSFGAHMNKSTYTEFRAGPNGKPVMDSAHIKDWVVQTIVSKFVERTFSSVGSSEASP